jgi:hypothetical protein
MFKRETRAESQICPDCGAKLAQERELLLCQDHGAFFAYGPQLLVRAPRPVAKSSEVELPWENQRAHLA